MANYEDKLPNKYKLKDLTTLEKTYLTASKYFCMLPWTHLHSYPNGDAYPCCLASHKHPIGTMREQTIEQLWNNDEMKQLRQNMLQEKSSKQCVKCYEQENNGWTSMRKSANKHFGHHIKEVHDTKPNGHYDKVNMIYWDIRFSNLCNLSCRYCGTYFSSNWYDDQVALFGKPNHPKVTYAGRSKTDAYDQLINYLPMVEQVYFAGGEPLIMEEHYKILKALIDIGKADQVRLIYNTNFTKLSYKKLNVLDLWPEFKDVSVGASLDAMGPRAELVRNGTVWKDVENNREQMLKKCPKVDFYISATLSAFNHRHVIDFHNEWVDKGFIKWQDWNMNVVQDPEHYRADILPLSVKEKVTVEYQQHIEKIEPFDHLGRATNGFRSAIKFINSTDNTKLLPKFRKYVELLDKRRQQNTLQVFPELKEVINE